MIRYLILGLLRTGSRMHGYALVKEYGERSGGTIGSGTFYRELQRLLREGLIRSSAGLCEIDARRTPYEITELGIAAFDAWFTGQVTSLGRFSDDELSARALFVPQADPAVVADLFNAIKESLWVLSRQLERERQRGGERAAGGNGADIAAIRSLLLARRQKYVAADLDLIDALLSSSQVAHRPAAIAATPPADPAVRKASRRRAEQTVTAVHRSSR